MDRLSRGDAGLWEQRRQRDRHFGAMHLLHERLEELGEAEDQEQEVKHVLSGASRCCLCGDKSISWSYSGQCTTCNQQVTKVEVPTAAPEGCASGLEGVPEESQQAAAQTCLKACVAQLKRSAEAGAATTTTEDPVTEQLEAGGAPSTTTLDASKTSNRQAQTDDVTRELEGADKSTTHDPRLFVDDTTKASNNNAGTTSTTKLESDMADEASNGNNGGTASTTKLESDVEDEDEGTADGSASKCCRCSGNNRIYWSIDGSCGKCDGKVDEEKAAQGTCANVQSKRDKIGRECNAACRELFGEPASQGEEVDQEDDSIVAPVHAEETSSGHGEAQQPPLAEVDNPGLHSGAEDTSDGHGEAQQPPLAEMDNPQLHSGAEDDDRPVQEDLPRGPPQVVGGDGAGGELGFNTFLESVDTVEGALKVAEQRAQEATQASSKWATEPKQAMQRASEKSAEEYSKVAHNLVEDSRKMEQEESRHFSEALGGS